MIETERLTLRPYRLEDYDAYIAVVADPALDFPSRQPVSREEAWHRVLRYAGHWALLGYGNLAVVERRTGQYVGETGLWDAHRGMGEDFDLYDEAGWFFAARVHGSGYGLEAADAAHRWYAATVRRPRTVCMIDPANDRSIRLATKLGYQAYRAGVYNDHQVLMFERCGT
jgi:RimJ/RimL family protein N-acetyltransferase